MIVECHACRARYVVPLEAFAAGGRNVRCARCKHEWFAFKPVHIDIFTASKPPKQEKDLSPSPASAGAMVMPTPNLPALIKDRKGLKRLEKIAKLFLLAIFILVPLFYYHVPIAKHLPILQRFYQVFGLYAPHADQSLVFDQVKSALRYDSGTMILFVDGVIHNTTDERQVIPDIKARALGPDKATIQSWRMTAPAATVAAQGNVPFHTEIAAPMEHTIEDVYLEFYTEEEASGSSK